MPYAWKNLAKVKPMTKIESTFVETFNKVRESIIRAKMGSCSMPLQCVRIAAIKPLLPPSPNDILCLILSRETFIASSKTSNELIATSTENQKNDSSIYPSGLDLQTLAICIIWNTNYVETNESNVNNVIWFNFKFYSLIAWKIEQQSSAVSPLLGANTTSFPIAALTQLDEQHQKINK